MATQLPPSIFNDVIGPVMRGPSSSHSTASVRIARMARDLCGGQSDSVLIQFDTEGSLATTHDSQGSDTGLFGGLFGWDADDERLGRSRQALDAAGVKLETRLVALSTGGGMIEVDLEARGGEKPSDHAPVICTID